MTDFGKQAAGKELDQLAINTIKTLAMDGVQAAKSGHPGMPMGTAVMAYTLWAKFLKHNPANPQWTNRDRFVLSAGHGSMLLYALLHVTGYNLPLEELKKFRQWGSKTPGHPEFGHTAGVETTTGPLGQGFATGVGMGLASKMLAARFNTPQYPLIDHWVYAIAGDGDMMEGVTSEAASLAGHLKLGNLIYLYDDNQITIEGNTSLAFSEDVGKRFEAYGWHVQKVNGLDGDQVTAAITQAQGVGDRPSLIVCTTKMAAGAATLEGSHEAHGAPLGDEEIAATKRKMGWPETEKFLVPEAVKNLFTTKRNEWQAREDAWKKLLAGYTRDEAAKAKELQRVLSGQLCDGLEGVLPVFKAGEAIASRNSSGKVLNMLITAVPELVGGSADLAPSNKTDIKNGGDVLPGSFGAKNMHFGIREHAMGSMLNGMAIYGGFIPYGGTFFVFADYMRPAIRLAALMKLRVIYVFTHDSIFVGEDGPTHQPIEHLASLRCIPNVTVIRPADANEVKQAWLAAIRNTTGPTALILSRQDLPTVDRTKFAPAEGLQRGAYTLAGADIAKPDVIFMASGSEVGLAMAAAEKLATQGKKARVVSMPSWELFDKQDAAYRAQVLPEGVKKVVIEAGRSMGWHKYAGADAAFVTIETFGASAPYKKLAEEFGLTVDNVVAKANP
jgi:transketolase